MSDLKGRKPKRYGYKANQILWGILVDWLLEVLSASVFDGEKG